MTDTLLSATSGKIKPGDLVLVAYPQNEQTNNVARKLDGLQFIVKRKKTICTRPANRVYYELYGAVSDLGVPYAFLDDELIRL
jgi:hypothetical protein